MRNEQTEPSMLEVAKVKPRAGFKEWAGLAVLALPTLLLGLDVTILYLALPDLAVDLQPSSTQALWIMDIYGFMIAGFLVTMGALGDGVGRRRLLMIGATAFAVASAIAAFSASAAMLIASRAMLGIAGATLMPSTLALISNMFAQPRERALAIGVWATMFAAGMAAGPIVGGWVLSHFWWGAAFLVAVPVILLLLVAAPLVLPEYRAPNRPPLDLMSVVLSLMAILLGIYAVKEMAKSGVDANAIVTLLAGVVLGFVFVRRQRRLADPLLDMALFSSRTFSAALVVLLVGLVGVSGLMLLVTQYLQLVAELSPLTAGLWMGPPALMMVMGGIIAPLIARHVPAGYIVTGALVLSIPGYGLLIMVGMGPSDVLLVVAGFSLVYLKLGMIAALGTDLVVGTAPREKAGSAAAMSELVQELGVAMGVALLGSLTALIYRIQIAERLSGKSLPESLRSLEAGLWNLVATKEPLPMDLLMEAKGAFIVGMNVTAAVSAAVALCLAVVAGVSLRHVRVLPDNP